MIDDPGTAAQRLAAFRGQDLTQTLAKIEAAIGGLAQADCPAFLSSIGAERDVLSAASVLKRLAGQIDVTIHALGILLCLPHILEPGERVEYVSLGAGNTGRAFDLETNLRIAEFKFARWQGGAETIRQNGVFKDFYLLAHSSSPKRKQLYLLGVDRARAFLTGHRAMSSVLSRGDKLKMLFEARFGDQFRTVGDYYYAHHHLVALEDASPWLSELAQGLLAEDVEVNTL